MQGKSYLLHTIFPMLAQMLVKGICSFFDVKKLELCETDSTVLF